MAKKNDQTVTALKLALVALRGIYQTLENGDEPYSRRVEGVLASEELFPMTALRNALEANGVTPSEIRELGNS